MFADYDDEERLVFKRPRRPVSVQPLVSPPLTTVLTGIVAETGATEAVVQVRGARVLRPPCSGLSPPPLAVTEKCSFMHKICQIPHPYRRLRSLSPLLDLATLTTGQRGHVPQ